MIIVLIVFLSDNVDYCLSFIYWS